LVTKKGTEGYRREKDLFGKVGNTRLGDIRKIGID
jgi:hypothetical protein